MKVFISGGAGFIGSHLSQRLLDRGDRVVILDDLSTGQMDNIEHLIGTEGFDYRVGSAMDSPLVAELVDRCDVTVHLADETLFGGVKPGSVTDYREISSNLARFSVHAPGVTDGTMLAENDQVLVDGNRYTIFLVAEDVSKNSLRIVRDDVIPDSGKARIRVVHAAPGAPELDVSIAGSTDKLFSGVNFKSEAGYKDVEPAVVTLELRANNEKQILLRIPKVDLKRSTSTTIVITGASKLSSLKFTDALMAPAPKT